MLTKDIRSGLLDIAYSRDHNATNPDMVPELPNGPYFVPGTPWLAGQWVRLVLEKGGRSQDRHFTCIGKLVSATETEAIVGDIRFERGPAPKSFEGLAWSGVLRNVEDAWNVVELTGRRDFEKEIGPMRAAVSKGNLSVVTQILDDGLPVDHALGLDGPPLVLAAKHGQDAVVKLLLERGASVDVRSAAGTLYEVARRGRATLELLALLRSHGAFTPEAAAAAAAPVVRFAVGSALSHAKFGAGTVLATEGTGDTMKVTVAFDDGAKRALLAKFLTQ